MNSIFRLTFSAVLLFSTYSFGFSAYDYDSSIHSWLKEGRSPVTEDLTKISSKKCIEALRQHLADGHSFSSQRLLENSLAIQNFPKGSTASQGILFHWTSDNAKANFQEMQNSKASVNGADGAVAYNGIFSYSKQTSCFKNTAPNGQFYKDVGCGSWPWYMYLAGDKTSSHPYGENLVQVTVRPEALVFFPKGDVPGKKKVNPSTVQSEIEKELIAAYPDLESCSGKKLSPQGQVMSMREYGNAIVHASPLLMLAVEASEIALIAHYGVNNDSNMYLGQKPAQWFQAVGPWTIYELSFLGKYPKNKNP